MGSQENRKRGHLVRYPVWTGATVTADGVLRPGLSLNPDVSVLRFHEEFRPNLTRSRLQTRKRRGRAAGIHSRDYDLAQLPQRG